MNRARLSDQAKEDLVRSWEYIARDNPSAADRPLQELVKQREVLAETPGMGRSRRELRPAPRIFSAGHYLILYRPISDGIAFFCIIFEACDRETLLVR